jgi:hypothetical protein
MSSAETLWQKLIDRGGVYYAQDVKDLRAAVQAEIRNGGRGGAKSSTRDLAAEREARDSETLRAIRGRG